LSPGGGTALIAIALGCLTVLLFIRAVGFDFIDLDDWIYVKQNPRVLAGLSWENIGWAFSTLKGANYLPLTWLGYMSIAQLFGPGPAGFHLANVLLHATNSVLVFLLLVDLTRARWRSALVAVLFAVHPLRLESVAWVAEFKDVLCVFFFLLTLLAYGRYVRASSRGRAVAWYFAAICLFVLGLLAKPMLVTLPFVLLLLDFWPLKRSVDWRRLLVEKIPFFAIAAGGSVLTFIAQRRGGMVRDNTHYPLLLRLGNAIWAYGRYLAATVWPARLSIYYPFEGVLRGTTMPWGLVGVSLAVLVLITLIGIYLWRRERAVLIGWLWFLGMLVPTIGIVQIGSHSMADRFSYLPHIGLLAAIVWGAAALIGDHPRAQKWALGAGALAAVLLASATLWQLPNWQNTYTIFFHSLKVTRNNSLANGTLGRAFQLAGDQAQAMKYYQEALRIEPDNPDTLANMGRLLREQKHPDEALPLLRRAVDLNPGQVWSRNSLGNTLADLHRYDQAIEQFDRAVSIDPDLPPIWINYGIALEKMDRWNDAADKFRRALKIEPNNPRDRFGYGMILEHLNRPAVAREQFEEALRLEPNWQAPAIELARLLACNPGSKVRDPRRAIDIAEALNRATLFQRADLLDLLAVAYASDGRFDQAIGTATRAHQLAVSKHQSDLAAQIADRLALYRAHRPFVASLQEFEEAQPTTRSARPDNSPPQ
jgi:tetratricopeptide (TPR) repeat protein